MNSAKDETFARFLSQKIVISSFLVKSGLKKNIAVDLKAFLEWWWMCEVKQIDLFKISRIAY